jgi:hypothetical protein
MPAFKFNDSTNRPPFEDPGDYTITIVDYSFATAQSSGNEMLELTMETPSGVRVYDNLVFTEKAYFKIDTALKCFMPSKGVRLPEKGEEFDIDDDFVRNALLGARGRVSLIKEPVKGKEGQFRNAISTYLFGEDAKKSEAKPAVTADAAKKPDAPKAKPFG